jgi:putative ABC transport system permease protein
MLRLDSRHLMDLALAVRSVSRNRARSAFALVAVAFGVVAVVLSAGFTEWQFDALRESTIRAQFGHMQITRPGFFSSGAADLHSYLLADRPDYIAQLERTRHVRLVASRLSFAGLVSHGETTVSFLAEGVEPEKERELSDQVLIIRGSDLAAEDKSGILLGEGLAESLGVEPGGRVVVLGNTASGSVNAIEGTVRGIFRTNTKAYDDAALRMPLGLARQLLRVSGSHRWVVLLDDTDYTDRVVAQVNALNAQLGEKLEVTPWYALADFYRKTVDLFSRQMTVVKVIIQAIIVLSILNTMMMSVVERTGEIGTMMATGTRRRRVLRLFVTEGLVLGLIGGAIGLVIGFLLAKGISFVGIPLPPPPGSNRPFTGQIFVTGGVAFNAFVLTAISATLASIYPAWRASRLDIVNALRRNI